MREVDRIEDQLRGSLRGDAWRGPALHELLADVVASEAALKPLSAAHSIWENVLHIIAWERVVYNGLTEKENSHAGKNDWLIQPTAIRCWNLSKGAQSVVVRGGEAIQRRTDILVASGGKHFATLRRAGRV